MTPNQHDMEMFPNFDQIREMSQDLARCLSDEHKETWCWIFARLKFEAPSPWAERLECAILELEENLPYRFDHDHFRTPVDLNEAYMLGFGGCTLPVRSALILNALITVLELALGSDHVDIQPIHRFRHGKRDQLIMHILKPLVASLRPMKPSTP